MIERVFKHIKGVLAIFASRKLLRFRALILCTLAALTVVVVWVSMSALQIHRTNLAQLRINLPEWVVGDSERALIIAPHCDDETLGCGGLIKALTDRGAKVKVVIATNGDGFYYAAARDLRDPFVLPDNYVDFGYQRQRESLSALARLGVHRSSVVFLGYPDRGLAAMWLYYWRFSDPYRSQYTHNSYSPYANSFRGHAPYSGRALLSDLKSIIADYQPTSIYYPHTNDQHSDHWAANCFVTQALYELGLIGKVKCGLYIVHRGDWPVPQGSHPTLPMAPPSSLIRLDTNWRGFPLSTSVAGAKASAIRRYKTQLPILRRFLMSFVRANEIFGVCNPGYIRKMHFTGWSNVLPCVHDPVGDGLNVDIGRNGDVKYIQCFYDDQYLYMKVSYAARCLRRIAYGMRIRGLPDKKCRIVNIIYANGITKGPAQAKMKGNTIIVKVPLSRIGRWNALMVSADSTFGQYQIDRSAWRLLLKQGGDAAVTPNPQKAGSPVQQTEPSPVRISP